MLLLSLLSLLPPLLLTLPRGPRPRTQVASGREWLPSGPWPWRVVAARASMGVPGRWCRAAAGGGGGGHGWRHPCSDHPRPSGWAAVLGQGSGGRGGGAGQRALHALGESLDGRWAGGGWGARRGGQGRAVEANCHRAESWPPPAVTRRRYPARDPHGGRRSILLVHIRIHGTIEDVVGRSRQCGYECASNAREAGDRAVPCGTAAGAAAGWHPPGVPAPQARRGAPRRHSGPPSSAMAIAGTAHLLAVSPSAVSHRADEKTTTWVATTSPPTQKKNGRHRPRRHTAVGVRSKKENQPSCSRVHHHLPVPARVAAANKKKVNRKKKERQVPPVHKPHLRPSSPLPLPPLP